jgi:hypothetical protein
MDYWVTSMVDDAEEGEQAGRGSLILVRGIGQMDYPERAAGWRTWVADRSARILHMAWCQLEWVWEVEYRSRSCRWTWEGEGWKKRQPSTCWDWVSSRLTLDKA